MNHYTEEEEAEAAQLRILSAKFAAKAKTTQITYNNTYGAASYHEQPVVYGNGIAKIERTNGKDQ
ncbi:hypothetical protein H1R20_g15513, partial [Candolleomyces eurysporus]